MNTLISASAGSGKTHALTTEYLRLLRQGQPPQALLAATFTRKAAGEIFDRALSRLASACLEENACAELCEALEDDALTQSDCQDLLRTLCAGLDRLAVGTLDGFFMDLCRLLGQGATPADPKSPRCVALRRSALHAMLRRLPQSETEAILDALNQNKASHAVLSKFDDLVKDLTEKLADAPPAAWVALTIPEPPPEAEIAAAQSILDGCSETLADGRQRKAVAGDLERFTAGGWEDFLTKGLAARCLAGETTYYNKQIPSEVMEAYVPLIEAARTEVLGDLQRRTHAIRDVLTFFGEDYRQQRRAEGLVLFSELPTLLLPQISDAAALTWRRDGSISHLLLDEFQDTSDGQWSVLRRFALRATEAGGAVFVVGDVKQAIYGWRGGRAEIFERVGSELPNMEQVMRDASFRSSRAVLETVNRVFADLGTNPVLDAHPGARDRWHVHFRAHTGVRQSVGCVEIRECPDKAEHESYCAAHIAEAVAALPPGATAGVLIRKNETGTRMADALRAQGLDVSSEGAGAIADDPAVEIILSALTFADHPGHTAAAFHVARSPLADLLCLPPDLHRDTEAADLASRKLRAAVLSRGFAGLVAEWAVCLAPYGQERTARRLEQLIGFAADMDALPPMRCAEFVAAARRHTAEHPGIAQVRVMTINHAKGLEFDAVFLPEMDWSAFGPTPACLVRRAPLSAEHPIAAIYRYPNKSVRPLAPELEAAFQEHQDEEITSMLCLLYVALTRAKYALTVFVGPAGGGKPTPAAILRHALAAGPLETLADGSARLYQWGDMAWTNAD